MPKFNKTHLSLELAEDRGILHRDYLAHCLRWSHAFKIAMSLRPNLNVLDLGCGKEFPFAKTLYVNKLSPVNYLGVDVNKLEAPSMLKDKGWFNFQTGDGATIVPPFQPSLITCFEVIEHMPFAHVGKLLTHAFDLLADTGVLLLSTPAYNGSAAGNHPNELKYEVTGSLLEASGFSVAANYGTFASIRDYKAEIERLGYAELFNQLHQYYDSNVLAVIFAPLFPALSRNVLWHCTKLKSVKKFPMLADIPKPWGNDPSVA